jgi:hypothetical protein
MNNCQAAGHTETPIRPMQLRVVPVASLGASKKRAGALPRSLCSEVCDSNEVECVALESYAPAIRYGAGRPEIVCKDGRALQLGDDEARALASQVDVQGDLPPAGCIERCGAGLCRLRGLGEPSVQPIAAGERLVLCGPSIARSECLPP